tara:strand:- start:2327 stop:2575 length:249 start_codon:yes stop_codon:yes gene_type:complete
MSFSYSSNVVTQDVSTTDTDLSGMAGLTGVTTETIGEVIRYILNASTDVNPQNAYLEIQVTIASKKTTWPRNNIVIKKGTIA